MAYRNLVITEPYLMRGDDVRELQEAINLRAKDTSYPPVEVDGVFGHQTLKAARREGRLIGAADLQLSGPVRARLQMILRDPRRRSPDERRRGIRRYRERREQIRREASGGRPVRVGEKYSDHRGRLWKVDADDAPHLVWFDGKPVARWIAPLLAQARRESWGGKVTNGWRSYAHQYDIYYVHKIRPAAKPGESNHQGSVYPRGAVDVTDWDGLRDALRRVQSGDQLRWYGPGDPPHFSATGR